jgi:Fe-S cluster assembly protein SufD
MQSKALLLSDGAAMNNKPELEIFADDVQCGHGATCGRLDKDQLFYLMARGIPRRDAESLLIEGFANEAFDGLTNEALRDYLGARVAAWLAGRSA